MLFKLSLLMVLMMTLGIDTGKYVTVEVVPARLELKEGQSMRIKVKFAAVGGVHVNLEPPLSIESRTQEVTFSIMTFHKSGDYLDLSRPVEVMCKAGKLNPGMYKTSFAISYTYCSDPEKWCRMGSDTLSVDIRVKR